jgi:hypothetical protein
LAEIATVSFSLSLYFYDEEFYADETFFV